MMLFKDHKCVLNYPNSWQYSMHSIPNCFTDSININQMHAHNWLNDNILVWKWSHGIGTWCANTHMHTHITCMHTVYANTHKTILNQWKKLIWIVHICISNTSKTKAGASQVWGQTDNSVSWKIDIGKKGSIMRKKWKRQGMTEKQPKSIAYMNETVKEKRSQNEVNP